MAKAFPKPDSIRIGSEEVGSPIDAVIKFSLAVTPASVAANTVAEQSVTVTGVLAGDIVLSVNPAASATNAAPVYAYVSANNTIKVGYVNPTAGAVTPSAGTYVFVVARFAKNY